MKMSYSIICSAALGFLIFSACGMADANEVATKSLASRDKNASSQRDHYHPYPPPPPPGHVETTELGSCLLIPAFDAADIQRDQAESGPDTIFYDLSMRQLTVIRITSFDGYGRVIYTETRNKCAPKPQHFEIKSNVGNEAFLAKKIRYFLKTQEANRCEPELKCF